MSVNRALLLPFTAVAGALAASLRLVVGRSDEVDELWEPFLLDEAAG